MSLSSISVRNLVCNFHRKVYSPLLTLYLHALSSSPIVTSCRPYVLVSNFYNIRQEVLEVENSLFKAIEIYSIVHVSVYKWIWIVSLEINISSWFDCGRWTMVATHHECLFDDSTPFLILVILLLTNDQKLTEII